LGVGGAGMPMKMPDMIENVPAVDRWIAIIFLRDG
jgi:hypothetical protein